MPGVITLDGKTVLVTGASSGIGKAIAIACAEAGARLVLLARNEERLAQTLQACKGKDHILQLADLTDTDSIPMLVRSICKQTGPLSGLVHSAGTHQPAPLRAITRKHLDGLFGLNAVAGVMLVKGLATKGCHVQGSSAVILSSTLGRVGDAGAIGYCMSKGAVEQAVKAMALELISQQIRVNCVAPAVIQTPMSERFFQAIGKASAQAIADQHPSGLGRPQDIAGAVVYLLSDASHFVTGTSLLIDGGYCAR